MIYENPYACMLSMFKFHWLTSKVVFLCLSYNERTVINRQKTFKVPLIKQERTS